MIRLIAYLCLVLVIQASLVPQGHIDDQHKAATIPGLEAIQKNILNNYIQNQGPLYNISDSTNQADQVPMPGGSIQAVRQKHNQLIDNYFKSKDASTSPLNIDQGTNNTIDGVHNIVESGTLNDVKGNKNILNGSKNNVSGSDNQIKGDENTITSDKNIVHGKGNVIMDGPGLPSDIKKTPNTPKPQLSGSPDHSKGDSASIIADSKSNLSTQFESYFALGMLLIALQLLL